MTDLDRDIFSRLAEWRAQGKGTALATVVSTWGSSPRPIGSHLAINEDGDFAGSVSGGCIEAAVVASALKIIELGDANSMEFGVTNDMAWQVGLSCGGTVNVFVEKIE